MEKSLKIILSGYTGKMGNVLRTLCETNPAFEVVAGIAVQDGEVIFPAHVEYQSPSELEHPGDVIIDFSHADSVGPIVDYARKRKIPSVICTTGLSAQTTSLISEASRDVAMFRSANMSLGVNLLGALLQKAASVLHPAGFDIEIIEKHHNLKVDAPSGTAFLLADAINEELGGAMRLNTSRSGIGRRNPDEIGIHAMRGGTIVGEHSVIFAGKDEVLEFMHSAQSKQVFATGALQAAQFIVGKPPGLYDMQDVLRDIL